MGRELFNRLEEPSKAHTAPSFLVRILGHAVTPPQNPSLLLIPSQACPVLKAPLKPCLLSDTFPDCQHRGEGEGPLSGEDKHEDEGPRLDSILTKSPIVGTQFPHL